MILVCSYEDTVTESCLVLDQLYPIEHHSGIVSGHAEGDSVHWPLFQVQLNWHDVMVSGPMIQRRDVDCWLVVDKDVDLASLSVLNAYKNN